jgi:hypothetical protein
MPQYIDAYGFILLQRGHDFILAGSWLFMPKEKIALNDFPRIIAAAFFGVAFNIPFGVEPYFPISASVIMVTTR